MEETKKSISEAEQLRLIRLLIKKRLEKAAGGVILLVDWDESRIAWEESALSSMYHTDFAKFDQILQDSTKDTGYFIELINSCEGSIVKI